MFSSSMTCRTWTKQALIHQHRRIWSFISYELWDPRLAHTRWRARSWCPRARSWPTSPREIDLRARRGRRATARRDKVSLRRFFTLPVCLEVLLWMKPIVDWFLPELTLLLGCWRRYANTELWLCYWSFAWWGGRGTGRFLDPDCWEHC
jgi:hypothetical protein